MKGHFYLRGVTRVLIIGLVLVTMSFVFGISCYSPAPTSTPAPTPSPSSTSSEIEISGFAFAPAIVTISAGTTLTWTNNDSVSHTVTSRDNLFDSGNLSGGSTFSYTFAQSGTFEYYCTIHPYMTAKVIIE